MIRNKEDILHYLSNKYDVPLYKVKEIVNYQFKFTSDKIQAGDFEAIRLPYFGNFSVNKNRVKHITKLKNEKTIKKI
jgi:nucleoid DNA-binding protein|tara:strand:+ start:2020 stop:2250 length:231 start_codon:yes stop_codon:yes gene_type:complete